MAGSAVLGVNLIDDLVPVIDELRDGLNADMGTRQWRAFVVRRSWSGLRRGEGVATDTELELVPAPRVTDRSLRNELLPTGRIEDGDIMLSEVSLTYTEGELHWGPLAANQEMFYELRDRWGQVIPNRQYVPDRPPWPDREQTIGWMISLRRRELCA